MDVWGEQDEDKCKNQESEVIQTAGTTAKEIKLNIMYNKYEENRIKRMPVQGTFNVRPPNIQYRPNNETKT
jgi:hypothetical protein